MKLIIRTLFLLGSLLGLSSACASVDERILNSPNYKNGKFENLEAFPEKSFFDVFEFWMGKWKEWPKWISTDSSISPKERIDEKNYEISFINHASFLIQIANLNIITDPHFSPRSSPLSFMGPKRVREPAVRFENLPPIDIVFISHNHYDHMDSESIERLTKKFDPYYIVGLNNAHYLEGFGVAKEKIIELDWWETWEHKAVQFHFTPAQHWSRRGFADTKTALWGALMIEHKKFYIYHGGDTGYGKHFQLTSQKISPPDIALIPIGAYEPRDFMKDQHLNPEDAVKAHIDLGAKQSIGMHFGTFQLTFEGIEEPANDLEVAKEKYNIQNFVTPTFGQVFKGLIP